MLTGDGKLSLDPGTARQTSSVLFIDSLQVLGWAGLGWAGLGWWCLNQADQCRVMTACVSCDARVAVVVASKLFRPPPATARSSTGPGPGYNNTVSVYSVC